jgi:hypothetical protein
MEQECAHGEHRSLRAHEKREKPGIGHDQDANKNRQLPTRSSQPTAQATTTFAMRREGRPESRRASLTLAQGSDRRVTSLRSQHQYAPRASRTPRKISVCNEVSRSGPLHSWCCPCRSRFRSTRFSAADNRPIRYIRGSDILRSMDTPDTVGASNPPEAS